MHKKLWNKDFILLLQASAVSTIGDLMYSVAIGYWVYEQTGSSSLMGVMTSISMFVTMFLSPFLTLFPIIAFDTLGFGFYPKRQSYRPMQACLQILRFYPK